MVFIYLFIYFKYTRDNLATHHMSKSMFYIQFGSYICYFYAI